MQLLSQDVRKLKGDSSCLACSAFVPAVWHYLVQTWKKAAGSWWSSRGVSSGSDPWAAVAPSCIQTAPPCDLCPSNGTTQKFSWVSGAFGLVEGKKKMWCVLLKFSVISCVSRFLYNSGVKNTSSISTQCVFSKEM